MSDMCQAHMSTKVFYTQISKHVKYGTELQPACHVAFSNLSRQNICPIIPGLRITRVTQLA